MTKQQQQQMDKATRILGQAVEASIHATHLALHGRDAHSEFEFAAMLKNRAELEWKKVELCDTTTH